MDDNVKVGAAPASMRGVCGVNGDAAKGRVSAAFLSEITIQPAIGRAFDARRADFHVILRIEMGARVVRRAGGMNDRELAFVVDAF